MIRPILRYGDSLLHQPASEVAAVDDSVRQLIDDMLSPVRMEFTYEVVRRDDQSIAASGHTIHAALDPAGKPCRLPDRIRRVFE